LHKAITLNNSMGYPSYTEKRNLAELERRLKNIGASKRIFRETIHEAEQNGDFLQMAHGYYGLGVIEGITDVSIAEPEYLSALEIYRHFGHRDEKITLERLVECRRIMGDYQGAENYRCQLEKLR